MAETIDQVTKRLNDAKAVALAPYNWLPPSEEEAANGLALTDTIQDELLGAVEDLFSKIPIDEFGPSQRDAEAGPGREAINPLPAGKKHGLKDWPYPLSDFTHVDPPLFSDTDLQRLKGGLGGGKATNEFEKLQRLVGPASPGMQRLAAVFEFIVLNVYRHLGALNSQFFNPDGSPRNPMADHPQGKPAYKEVRDGYIRFLRDLDDHEPQTKQNGVVPGERGYGRTIKWSYILPYVLAGKIIGASVVVHWNPHSSSAGVPIQH